MKSEDKNIEVIKPQKSSRLEARAFSLEGNEKFKYDSNLIRISQQTFRDSREVPYKYQDMDAKRHENASSARWIKDCSQNEFYTLKNNEQK